MHFVTIAITLLSLTQYVVCWGDVGHRTVGDIAEKCLSPQSHEYLSGILANDQGYDFSDAAIWADSIKHGSHPREYTAAWHYMDALDSPPTNCNVDYQRDCFNSEHPGGCVISAIMNQTSLFLDPNSDDIVRREALMFIIHFIGDLHQPLHVEDAYTGGNDIPTCFRKACAKTELHAVWDTDIIHKIVGLPPSAKRDEEKTAASSWATQLYNANKGSINKQCIDVSSPQQCALKWATEANEYVCSYVFNVGGLTDMEEIKTWFNHKDLSTDYYDGAAPIVEKLIGLSGIRLGAYLEALVAAAQGVSVPESQQILRDAEL